MFILQSWLAQGCEHGHGSPGPGSRFCLDFEDDADESELDDELETVSAVEVGPLLMQR